MKHLITLLVIIFVTPLPNGTQDKIVVDNMDICKVALRGLYLYDWPKSLRSYCFDEKTGMIFHGRQLSDEDHGVLQGDINAKQI